MGRTLDPTLVSEISAANATLFYFMQFSFSGGETYLCTAPHNISWNNHVWIGIGGNISFDAITEGADLAGHGIQVTLSGVDQSVVAIILSQKYVGRFAQIWLAHVNASNPIISPMLRFKGRMNGGFEIDETREKDRPGTVTIRGRMTDRMGDMQRVQGIMTNLEGHQKFAPGDLFFKDVANLVGKKIFWGRK